MSDNFKLLNGQLVVTGSTDQTLVKVIANSTQTSNPLQIFQSNGSTNLFNVSGSGNITAAGSISATNISGSSSGTNSGDVTLTAVGASPNADGASLSGQALTLQPADGTNPGLLTAASQTIGGTKTFTGSISASNLSGTNTGDQTITLTGDVTGSGTGTFATTVAQIAGTTVSGTTGTTNVVFSANPTITGLLAATRLGLLGGDDAGSAITVGTSLLTGTAQNGINLGFTASSAATGGFIGFYSGTTTTAASFTSAFRANFYADSVAKGSGSTITRDIGVFIAAPNQGTNNAAIADNLSFTGSWFINSSSTNASTLGGNLTTLGTLTVAKTATLLNGADTSSALSIGTTLISGAGTVQSGIDNTFTASSSATSFLIGFSSSATTTAASFTLGNRTQFYAANTTKGAGSTITRDISYYTEIPSQGTNNAVLADNTSFTGNWFINQSGTNASLLSGSLDVATLNHSSGVAVHGTNTNDNASAGYVGEYIESLPGIVNATTSGQFEDLTSISLTAGDWDITLVVSIDGNGSTMSAAAIGISTTSGNSITGLNLGVNRLDEITDPSIGQAVGLSIPNFRVSLSTTTTYYAKFLATYSSGTPRSNGSRLSARRMR